MSGLDWKINKNKDMIGVDDEEYEEEERINKYLRNNQLVNRVEDFNDIEDLDIDLKNISITPVRTEMRQENKNISKQQPESKIVEQDKSQLQSKFDEDIEEDLEIELNGGNSLSEKLKNISSSIKSKSKFVIFSILIILLIFNLLKIFVFKEKKPVVNTQVQQSKTYTENDYLKEFDEFIDITDNYYSDEIVVTKFIKLQNNSVECYFSGIPKNFKQSITFRVSVETYNKIATGNKIFIDYNIYEKEGKSYVVNVRTNLD